MIKSFFSQLNGRLMVIHFIAFWFFIFAFQTLAFVHDYNFLYLASERTNRLNNHARFLRDMGVIEQSGIYGLLTAYIISWSICTRRNWFWANSVIIFLLAFVFKVFGLLGWNYLHSFFQLPGKIFDDTSIWGYLTNGAIMLIIGLLLFFYKPLVRYIERGDPLKQKNTVNKKQVKTKTSRA
jgi:hypothetical protein